MKKRISNPTKGLIVILMVVIGYCVFERFVLGNTEVFNFEETSTSEICEK